jgi:hypothetical protein
MLSPGSLQVGFSKDGKDHQLVHRNRRNPNPRALSVFGSKMSERNIELSCFLDNDQLYVTSADLSNEVGWLRCAGDI